MSDSLFVLEGVSKAYREVKAVTDVDLRIAPAERLAVIGPNGAGKSTLFGMIAGEHRPTDGRITYEGRDITRWPPSRRAAAGISRTFQVARLFGSMSVRENVHLAVRSARRSPHCWDALAQHRSTWSATDECLERVGLTDLASVTSGVLAQGARKSLEIAMAIAQAPRVLLLDEPTAGMGYDDARGTVDLLCRLLDTRPELTIILTAHDMDVVHRVAQRVVLMARGRTILDGTPDEVACHATTRELYLGRAENRES